MKYTRYEPWNVIYDNLRQFLLIFIRCQNGKINAHGTCICNENFEEASLGICLPIMVPAVVSPESRTGCAEGYKWNPDSAKCEIMVAGFSFIGEFALELTRWRTSSRC